MVARDVLDPVADDVFERTRVPNATVARIAIFAAASAPFTSSVGSASAYPRRCASASASSYSAPASMRVRMKFVVPLTMPRMRWTVVTTSASRSTLTRESPRRRGLEPELDAGVRGGAEELVPALGDELLVRGDDRLPRAQEAEHPVAGLVDAAHDLGDDGDRRVADDLLEVGREHALGGKILALAIEVAHQCAHDAQAMAGRALDVVGALRQQPVDGSADRAVAEQRDRDVDRAHHAASEELGIAPEAVVDGPHGPLDVVRAHEAGDPDRRGRDDLDVDAGLGERVEHVRRDARVRLHARADQRDLRDRPCRS